MFPKDLLKFRSALENTSLRICADLKRSRSELGRFFALFRNDCYAPTPADASAPRRTTIVVPGDDDAT